MKTKEIKKISEIIIDNRPKIKIQLDYKTIITVRSMGLSKYGKTSILKQKLLINAHWVYLII
ncbi:hypothetical protein SAMN05444372_105185 [Flavobacterium micromati]|jgi:hypothetical protein|uniref:Uncharacterized protein n=1 Tax=Flavobacterium micromati TaxID=229205 RepID=A0A1M5JGR0_9FLAO|nr:hypothetical protein [Flavobacterium micromati]SHG39742.1 hypothetical protein SAMN05444372_105185 [Flavobacterium micromati]